MSKKDFERNEHFCQYSGCAKERKPHNRTEMKIYKHFLFCSTECIEGFKLDFELQ